MELLSTIALEPSKLKTRNRFYKIPKSYFTCISNGCRYHCRVKTSKWFNVLDDHYTDSDCSKPEKAGVLIFDRNNNFLLVQSYNYKWGFPKGSIIDGETPQECAIREVKEEIGIDINLNKCNKMYFPFQRMTIFTYIMRKPLNIYNFNLCNVENDSTGIGVFNHSCIIANVHNKTASNIINEVTLKVLKKYKPF